MRSSQHRTDFSAVREALEKAGIPLVEAQIAMIPQTYVELTDDQAIKASSQNTGSS